MPKRIVIIGAGALGMSCAWQLAGDAGFQVTVLDRAHPGSGSSGVSAGVFTRQYVSERDIALRVRAVQLLERLARRTLLQMHHIGFLRLARDTMSAESFASSVRLQRDMGVVDSTVLEPAQLKALVPPLDVEGVVAALYCPSDGYVDGSQLCTFLAEEAKASGVRVVSRATVLGLRRGMAARYVVETDAGSYPADIVVNAAGAWAERVGDSLGAPVTVVNERHEAFVLQLPPGCAQAFPMTMDYVPGGAEPGLYFRQEGAMQLIAGLHSNDIIGDRIADPDSFVEHITEPQLELVMEKVAAALPDMEIGFKSGWAGLYPHSSTQQFVIGPHPRNPDVMIGVGLGGVGLHTAPALGEVLADWIRYDEPRSLPFATDWLPNAKSLGLAPVLPEIVLGLEK